MTFNDNIFQMGLGIMRHADEATTNQIVACATQNSVNYFEACHFYLNYKCEERLANALQHLPRHSYYLCDKFPTSDLLRNQNIDLNIFFKEQLKKCNVNYFDFYLLQAIDRNNYHIIPQILPFFLQKKEEGLIHNLGFSFHDNVEILKNILDMAKWDIVQLQLNYYDWYLGEAKQLYNLVKQYDLPISVMGPCKGGLLTRDLPESSKQRLQRNNINAAYLCYKFLTTLSNVKIILSGADNLQQLKENLQFFHFEEKGLTQYEKEQMLLNIEDYKKNNLIQCTNCKYCLNKCPQNIPINEIFYHYNQFLSTGEKNSQNILYNIFKSSNSSNNCKNCKSCENNCPQHLPITSILAKQIFPMRL